MKKVMAVFLTASIVFGSTTIVSANNSGKNDQKYKTSKVMTMPSVKQCLSTNNCTKVAPKSNQKSDPKCNNGKVKVLDKISEKVRSELIAKCDSMLAQLQQLKSYIIKDGKLLVEFKDAQTANAAIQSIDQAIVKINAQKDTITKSNSSKQLKDIMKDYCKNWINNQFISKRINGLTSAAKLKAAYESAKQQVDKLGVAVAGLTNQTTQVKIDEFKKAYTELQAKLDKARTTYLDAINKFATVNNVNKSDKFFKDAQETLMRAKKEFNSCIEKANRMLKALNVSATIPEQTDMLQYQAGNAVVKDSTIIEVKFSAPIASVDPSLLAVYQGSNVISSMISATIKSTDATVVIFKTAAVLDSDPEKYILKVNRPDAIKSVKNSVLTINGKDAYSQNAILDNLKDSIKPSLVQVEKGIAPNSIKFTFTENLKNDTATKTAIVSGLLLKDKEGNVLAANASNSTAVIGTDKTVTVVLAGSELTAVKGTADGEKEIKVSFPVAAGIIDASSQANVMLPVGDQAVKIDIDTTGPIASVSSGSPLVLTYNEALYIGGVIVVNDKDIANQYIAAGGVTITSAIYNSTNKTVTFVLSNISDGSAITSNATITDQAGNTRSTTSDKATYIPANTTWNLD